MSFESDTIATLAADDDIIALVAARITFVTAPQDPAAPFLVLRRISTDPTLSTDNGAAGSFELDNIRLEVSCNAKTSKQANDIARLVRRCLERARPTIYVMQDLLHDYSDMPDLYQTVVEFSCWHPDQIPS